jgi:leucyl/phenylalanyl-tRNA---protein transferase
VERDELVGGSSRRRLGRRLPPQVPGLAPRPRPVPPSAWMFPEPARTDEDGVVGVGADLSPATLVDAYRHGIFPWPHPDVPLPWFSPDPRGVIELDRLHVSRSLHRTLRASGWTTTVDAAFERVVTSCALDRGEAGTWITPTMVRAYQRLQVLGWAHSLEVWSGDELVGGVYGVQVGGVFTGESMFHRVADASKVALVDLVARLAAAGGRLLDVQITTDHLRSLGARDLPRAEFLDVLAACRDDDVRLQVGREPVSRHVRRD